MIKDAVLIAGPTASGKSALAVAMAEKTGGVVVNADSMQVYSILDILTARPSAKDRARAPHKLYGHIDPSDHYSAGHWLRDVEKLAREGAFSSGPPVFVGGTGLYFRALTEGLAETPEIPKSVRDRWRYELSEKGPVRLHRILSREDPDMAQSIRPTDGQRLVRALEVLETTGKSIREWRQRQGPALVDPRSAKCIVVEPDRADLAVRIRMRLQRMVEAGALKEVDTLAALGLPPAMPAMKAIGVREFLAANRGEISLNEAMDKSAAATRQYAKRQMTWFRNQAGPEWDRIPPGVSLDGSRTGCENL